MKKLPAKERAEIMRARVKALYLSPCGRDPGSHITSYWAALYGLEDAEQELVKEQQGVASSDIKSL